MTRGLARHWPIVAILLVATHALLHVYLQSRPGAPAVAVFLVAPRVLFVLTVLSIAAAIYDILYGGWRRLLRGTVVFPVAALVASTFLALITYRVYPSSYDDRTARWCLALPLAGELVVLQGGRTLDSNAHAGDPSQRYAYDLSILKDGSEALNDDAYGRPVSAPMAGVVVAVGDGVPDQAPGAAAWPHGSAAIGNHVVLQIDDGQFLFVGRLQSGSTRVRPGDRVEAGEPLGRVGNPDAGVPRLHVHLQDQPELHRGEAIPVDFCHYEVIDSGATWDTAQSVERGMPTGRDHRQIIRAQGRPPR